MSNIPSGWPAERPLAVSVCVMLEGWASPDAPGIGPMGNPSNPAPSICKPGPGPNTAPRSAPGGCSICWIRSACGRCSTPPAWWPSVTRSLPLPSPSAATSLQRMAGRRAPCRLPDGRGRGSRHRAVSRCCVNRRGASRRLAQPALHAERAHLAAAGESGVSLARGHVRQRPAIFDRDQAGPLLGVPFTMEVNDMPLYVRYGNEPDTFTHTLENIVAGWPRLGSPFGCLDITVHAHVFGRPYGALALLQFTRGRAPASLVLADGSRPAD